VEDLMWTVLAALLWVAIVYGGLTVAVALIQI
jgi:hypothetical protein